MQTNFEHCAALVREADRDRFLATLFAPAQHREALFALYAFNVEIARVRELAREPMPGEIRLQWWREVLSGERDGEAAAHPVAAALTHTLNSYDIRADRLIALIDARAFDLYEDPMATLEDLETYGIKTQSTLLAIDAEILVSRGVPPDMLSLDAGVAYTISGILNGFAGYVARRQLYVPLDVLERYHVKHEDIFAGRTGEPLLAALAELRGHARRRMGSSKAKLDSAPTEILPAYIPVALVGPQFRRMERRGYEPFVNDQISPWRRQWLLWRAARDPSRIFRT